MYLSSRWRRIHPSKANSALKGSLVPQTVLLEPHDAPHSVTGQQDELIVLRNWERDPIFGAVAGVVLNKEITAAAVRQAKAEYLLFGCRSRFPFIQVNACS